MPKPTPAPPAKLWKLRALAANTPTICSAPSKVMAIPIMLMAIPIVMARRVMAAAYIRVVLARRVSRRERRVSPHVQMMERKENPMPDPARKNPPVPFLKAFVPPACTERTDLANIKVIALTVVKITCTHQESQLDRRKALDACAISGSIFGLFWPCIGSLLAAEKSELVVVGDAIMCFVAIWGEFWWFVGADLCFRRMDWYGGFGCS